MKIREYFLKDRGAYFLDFNSYLFPQMGVRKLPLFRHSLTSDGFPIEKERKKYETERGKL